MAGRIDSPIKAAFDKLLGKLPTFGVPGLARQIISGDVVAFTARVGKHPIWVEKNGHMAVMYASNPRVYTAADGATAKADAATVERA